MTLDLEPIKARLDESFLVPYRVRVQESANDVPALIAEVERLRDRIKAALTEMDESMYGDPEAVFRMRGRLDPERAHGQFRATYLNGEPA